MLNHNHICRFLNPLFILIGVFLIVMVPVRAQPDVGVLEEAYHAAYGFDGLNGRNNDWRPFNHTFEDGVEMVLVPPGRFFMGTDPMDVDAVHQLCFQVDTACNRQAYELEVPRHEQTLDGPYWIDRYEISRQQYMSCVDAGECSEIPPNENSSSPNDPLNKVTWEQAEAYCRLWRKGRLPTETEWEYAARGPSNWVYAWGDTFRGTTLNYCDQNCTHDWRSTDDDGYSVTAPIGSYPGGTSWVGALDMSGNLWEWTSSLLRRYPYNATDGRETSSNNGLRVVRGGSYNVNQTMTRAAARFWLDSQIAGNGVGFRCVREFDF